jgi:hypothetical protein
MLVASTASIKKTSHDGHRQIMKLCKKHSDLCKSGKRCSLIFSVADIASIDRSVPLSSLDTKQDKARTRLERRGDWAMCCGFGAQSHAMMFGVERNVVLRAPCAPKPGHMAQSPRLVREVAPRLKGKILSLLVSGRSAA